MDAKKLGLRIREQRKKHGYTQAQLSELCGLGQRYIGEIERGKRMPSLSTFIKIINLFNDIPADTLLRDALPTSQYMLNEITVKMRRLTPMQTRLLAAIVDTVIDEFENETAGYDATAG